MPAALPIDWDAIKMAACAGVRYNTLARKFGLLKTDGSPDTSALRKRAEREHWPIPSRVIRSARLQAKANGPHPDLEPGDVTLCHKGHSDAVSGQLAAVTVTEDLLANGQTGTLLAQQIALRSLQRAPESLAIASPGDLKTAMQVVRIAAGMDSGEGARVSIGLFGGSGSAMSRLAVDVSQDVSHGDCDGDSGDSALAGSVQAACLTQSDSVRDY